jgi:hypothetical protein
LYHFQLSERKTYFCIENTGFDNALFSFGSEEAGIFSLQISGPSGHTFSAETSEQDLLGILQADSLSPKTEYHVSFTVNGKTLHSGTFKTLERPKGKPQGRFAVAGDPHISLYKPNRRGRMYSESDKLLRETLNRTVTGDIGSLLIPGDLTDAGTPEEIKIAKGVIRNFPVKVFLVEGDHDIGNKSSDTAPEKLNWSPFIEKLNRFNLLGLDTSSGTLPRNQVDMLKEILSREESCIILAHHNLIKNPDILDDDAPIANHKEAEALLLESRCRWIIYCGHKNLPLKLGTPKGVQLNTPQLLQYPAGYLTVNIYPAGLFHQFIPVRSEILRNYSLRMLYQSDDPSYSPAYRYGSLEGRSFFLKI